MKEAKAMILQGNVIKYGDNIDTDVIIPARYLNTSDPAELAKHCMEDIDKEFTKKVRVGRRNRRGSKLWLRQLARTRADCD